MGPPMSQDMADSHNQSTLLACIVDDLHTCLMIVSLELVVPAVGSQVLPVVAELLAPRPGRFAKVHLVDLFRGFVTFLCEASPSQQIRKCGRLAPINISINRTKPLGDAILYPQPLPTVDLTTSH